jgi:hypothetical protein
LDTATLAELYLKQGLIGRAREIYGRLAAGGSEQARQRLQELPSGVVGRIAALERLLEQVRSAGRRY